MHTSYFPVLTCIISSYFTDFDTVHLCHLKQGHVVQEYYKMSQPIGMIIDLVLNLIPRGVSKKR